MQYMLFHAASSALMLGTVRTNKAAVVTLVHTGPETKAATVLPRMSSGIIWEVSSETQKGAQSLFTEQKPAPGLS